MLIWAAFVFGLLGSFHCIGMCGPIAMALPLNRKSKMTATIGGMSYHLGRLTTYGVFGALFGFLGKGLVLVGFQQSASIIIGVIMIMVIFMTVVFKKNWHVLSTYFVGIGRLKSSLGKLFQKKSVRSFFTIGLLNGLLPCGLVYMGVLQAIATGNSIYGAAVMVAFGLGTVPMMSAVLILGNFISINARNKMRKFVPVIIVLFGLLLIFRGLNMGIPYLSPEISQGESSIFFCY